MSQSKVYLCPSCQSVIRSESESPVGLICDDCGFEFGAEGQSSDTKTPPPPKTSRKKADKLVVRDVMKQRSGNVDSDFTEELRGPEELAFKEGAPGEQTGEIPPGEDEVILPDGTKKIRRRKRKKDREKHKKLYIFLTAWVSIIAIVVALFQLGKDPERRKTVKDSEQGGDTEAARERIFYREHLPKIVRNFQTFMQEENDQAKQQLIDQSSRLAAKYSRFYEARSLPSPVGRLKISHQDILELQKDPFVPAVEVQWVDDEGKMFESVHVWDGKNWQLDWEQFARYSSVPWVLFKSNLGKKKEGEFRLFVRKRETAEETKYLTLLFYQPQQGLGDDAKRVIRESESPEVKVERKSKLGKKILRILKDREVGSHPYGSELTQKDPSRLTRITVLLAWEKNKESEEDEENKPEMVLKDIVGLSWYGSRIQEAYAKQQASEKQPQKKATSPDQPKEQEDSDADTKESNISSKQ